MKLSLDLYSILLGLGIFQGIFLSLVLVFRKGYQNRFLAAVLVILSFSSFVTLLWETGYIYRFPHVIGVTTPFLYLLGPFFWFYVHAIFSGKVKWSLIALHSFPFILCLALISPFYFEGATSKLDYIDDHVASESLDIPNLRAYYYGFLLIQLAGYLIATHQYVKNISTGRRPLREWRKWVFILLTGLEILAGAYLLVFGLYLFSSINTTILRDGLFLLVTFFIHFVAYLSINKASPLDNPVRSAFDQGDARDLKEKLEMIFDKEKPFLNQGFKLSDLAVRLDMSPQKLSELINSAYGVSFSDLLNQYRVAKVKDLLQDSTYQIYDLEGIADQTGFKSRVNLTRVFKKITGQSPTAFKKRRV